MVRRTNARTGEDRIWTVPNMLSMFRLAMVVSVGVCFFYRQGVWAMVLYVLAMLTDLIDGYIARKYNQITKLGKLLDPIADKLMFVVALCGLFIMGYLPGWMLLIVAIKEGVMIIGGLVIMLAWKNVVFSNTFGKIASFSYSVGIVACFLHVWIAPVDTIIMGIAVLLNVIALCEYAYLNVYKVLVAKHREKKIEDTTDDAGL